jgi:hypothetical protein
VHVQLEVRVQYPTRAVRAWTFQRMQFDEVPDGVSIVRPRALTTVTTHAPSVIVRWIHEMVIFVRISGMQSAGDRRQCCSRPGRNFLRGAISELNECTSASLATKV